MGFRNNLTGKKYHKLTVLEYSHMERKYSMWKCKCDCGNIVTIKGASVKCGNTKSCGCLGRGLKSVERNHHGHTSKYSKYNKEYKIWRSMLHRCNNPNNKYYHIYGKKGIKVCERWYSYINFFKDMGPRPLPEYSLDRIDNNGNYSPENCRWANRNQQNNNKSTSKYLVYNGVTLTQSQWAKLFDITQSSIYYHLKKGANFNEIVCKYIKKPS